MIIDRRQWTFIFTLHRIETKTRFVKQTMGILMIKHPDDEEVFIYSEVQRCEVVK